MRAVCMLLICCMSLISLNSFGKTQNNNNGSIIFMVPQRSYVATIQNHPSDMQAQTMAYGYPENMIQQIVEDFIPKAILSKKIISQIREIRGTLCQATGDADVKVWLSGDAKANIGIGISGQSGIEVTFHCRDSSQYE